jgi:hypothetical protein
LAALTMPSAISVVTRIASPSRITGLTAFENDQVTFRWRDSAHKNKRHLMTLHVNEFLRRFLLHVLPPRFVRIDTSVSSARVTAAHFCRCSSVSWENRPQRKQQRTATILSNTNESLGCALNAMRPC